MKTTVKSTEQLKDLLKDSEQFSTFLRDREEMKRLIKVTPKGHKVRRMMAAILRGEV
jgi:hypothetical protein